MTCDVDLLLDEHFRKREKRDLERREVRNSMDTREEAVVHGGRETQVLAIERKQNKDLDLASNDEVEVRSFTTCEKKLMETSKEVKTMV